MSRNAVPQVYGLLAWFVLTVGPVLAQQPDPFGPPPQPAVPPDARVPANPLQGPPAAGPPAELFQPAETAARVGDQFIFMGELLGDANITIALGTGVDRQSLTAEQQATVDIQRKPLIEQLLSAAIDRKRLYIEFLRTIPAEKLDEALASIGGKVSDNFSENLFKMLDRVNSLPTEEYPTLIRQEARLFRLAYLMKQRNLTSLGQLETVLRANGSSLEKQKDAYAERLLGQQQLREAINRDPEVTHVEILNYYKEHPEEFHVLAQAKWRQITVRFNRCSSRQQAGEMIAAIGNELALGGAPFWAVAKRSSHDPRAQEGGLHDWTEQGDLEVSQQIDATVFQIPLNQLSRIIQDAEGLHIVIVLDRKDAHMIPFNDAQVDIKTALQNKKRSDALTKYVARIKEQIPVWSTLVR